MNVIGKAMRSDESGLFATLGAKVQGSESTSFSDALKLAGGDEATTRDGAIGELSKGPSTTADQQTDDEKAETSQRLLAAPATTPLTLTASRTELAQSPVRRVGQSAVQAQGTASDETRAQEEAAAQEPGKLAGLRPTLDERTINVPSQVGIQSKAQDQDGTKDQSRVQKQAADQLTAQVEGEARNQGTVEVPGKTQAQSKVQDSVAIRDRADVDDQNSVDENVSAPPAAAASACDAGGATVASRVKKAAASWLSSTESTGAQGSKKQSKNATTSSPTGDKPAGELAPATALQIAGHVAIPPNVTAAVALNDTVATPPREREATSMSTSGGASALRSGASPQQGAAMKPGDKADKAAAAVKASADQMSGAEPAVPGDKMSGAGTGAAESHAAASRSAGAGVGTESTSVGPSTDRQMNSSAGLVVAAGSTLSGTQAHGLHGDGAASAKSSADPQTNASLRIEHYEATASNRLEVGLADGASGWLKVRAQVGEDGLVHASLRGSSAEMESGLRDRLSDLTTYLSAEHVPVHRVEIISSDASSASASSTMSDSGGGGDQGRSAGSWNSDSGNASNRNSENGGGPARLREERSASTASANGNAMQGSMSVASNASAAMGFAPESGMWLSVMA